MAPAPLAPRGLTPPAPDTGEPAAGAVAFAREFESFVRSRTPALLRSAYLLTGDQHLAEDLVQSALARTHRAWSTLHRAGNAEAYTRRVMYHLQVSWWRRRRARESFPGELPEPARGVDAESEVLTRVVVRAALAALTPRQRAVVVLRYFEDRTEVQTADLLGVAVGTVKSQHAKALARLRAVAPGLIMDRTEGSRS